MPEEIYTHEFNFEIDGQYLRGELEFNTDGKTTAKIHQMTPMLYLDTISAFKEFVDVATKIYNDNHGFTTLRIKKK